MVSVSESPVMLRDLDRSTIHLAENGLKEMAFAGLEVSANVETRNWTCMCGGKGAPESENREKITLAVL